jgi:hypothetical protein
MKRSPRSWRQWLAGLPAGERAEIEKPPPSCEKPACDERTGLAASAASLSTDLELARTQPRELRAERDKLWRQIRLQLGSQLEQVRAQTLADRTDELTAHNQRLADQHSQAQAENHQLRQRITRGLPWCPADAATRRRCGRGVA